MSDKDELVPLNKGDKIWYVVNATQAPRPAVVISDGISETHMVKGRQMQYVTLQYGTAAEDHVLLGHESPKAKSNDPDDRARVVAQRQMHEVTAPWDPNGLPGTWHLDGECPHLKHPVPAGESSAPEAP